MKKFALALVVILASAGYVFVSRGSATTTQSSAADSAVSAIQSSSDTAPIQITNSTSVATPVAQTNTQTPTVSVQPAPAPKPSGQYVDGTYAGSVADAYYGNIQVEAVISGGKLSNVKVLQYPNDRSTSIEINRQALPILVSEAISAQSANVDGVSGASDTSPAFVQSLSSALAQAKT